MKIFDHDEDNNTEEELNLFLKLSRISRRNFLSKGDQSREIEDPFEMLNAHIAYVMAENQEKTDERFGGKFVTENTFTNGSLRWLTEPGDRDRTMILLGVMMSIYNAQTMIDLVNDLGLNDKDFMEVAKNQIEHLHEHQETCNEAVEQAQKELDPKEILSEIKDILGDQGVDADKD